jgi:hypothetical protein
MNMEICVLETGKIRLKIKYKNMKYKYRLVEQEEIGDEENQGGREKKKYDLILTPLGSTAQDVVNALEKIDNYGVYIPNIRNNKAEVEKAVIDHFGPNQPFIKKKLEKERGKPFPPKTKLSIEAFIKTLSPKPNLLRWKIKDYTLLFPNAGNPSRKVTEKIIDTVMNNAGLDYDLESIESSDISEEKINTHNRYTVKKETLKEFEDIEFSPANQLFDDVKELIKTRTRKMNDDDAFEFHEKLKKWANSLI